jgi:hypothetical protein
MMVLILLSLFIMNKFAGDDTDEAKGGMMP